MPLHVSGYTREVNGHLIQIGAYTQDKITAAAEAVMKDPDRPPVVAKVATYGQHKVASFPGGRDVPGYFPEPVPNPHVALSAQLLELSTLGDQAASAWAGAVTEGLQHFLLVARNNPKKALEAIAKRPDVKEALNSAGQDGAQAVARQIVQAWLAGGGPTDSPYLRQLLRDALRNGEKFRSRVTQALTGQAHEDLPNLLHGNYQLRARAGMAVASTRSKQEEALSRFEAAGIKQVMWANWGANPCPDCVALHGAVVDLGDEFDHGVRPVFGKLTCPPRHPFCECRLVPLA